MHGTYIHGNSGIHVRNNIYYLMWLDREQSQIGSFLLWKNVLHACETCSELPSNTSTNARWGNRNGYGGGRSEKANCEETLARHPEGREAVIPAGYLFCYPFRWSIKELMKIVEEEEGQRGGCTRYLKKNGSIYGEEKDHTYRFHTRIFYQWK